ncbi:cell division protein FtsK, partial [Streptosporangium sp. NPDC006013]
MFKKLPGDEAQNLVSTTPDTAVVFRPAIVRTPAILTILIFTWRLLAGLLRLLWRHPIASAVTLTPGALTYFYGWRWGLGLVVLVPLGLTAWCLLARPSFLRLVGWRLLAWWRRVWIYRRHWQPVMIISGLGRHLRGRDYLPRIVRVTCTSWADLVTVRMLTGQSVKDWADRTDHLAHGFGARSCRVSIARSGRLLLVFPRRDPLATPLPAVSVPEEVSVGPVEVGTCED